MSSIWYYGFTLRQRCKFCTEDFLFNLKHCVSRCVSIMKWELKTTCLWFLLLKVGTLIFRSRYCESFCFSHRCIALPHYFLSFDDAPDSGQKQIPLFKSQQIINIIIFSLCIFLAIEKYDPSLHFRNLFYFDLIAKGIQSWA